MALVQLPAQIKSNVKLLQDSVQLRSGYFPHWNLHIQYPEEYYFSLHPDEVSLSCSLYPLPFTVHLWEDSGLNFFYSTLEGS